MKQVVLESRSAFMKKHVRSRSTSAVVPPFLTTMVKVPVPKLKTNQQEMASCWLCGGGCFLTCTVQSGSCENDCCISCWEQCDGIGC